MPLTNLSPFSTPDLQDRKILVFGKDGQLGISLQKLFLHLKIPVVFLGREQCDLSQEQSILQNLKQYQPQIILNAAAYTQVDMAEQEYDLSQKINSRVPRILAEYIAPIPRGVLVHVSTDYVFDGLKTSPYLEIDETRPMSQYGMSKRDGELEILETFHRLSNRAQEAAAKFFILRTSWVYGQGNNFIRTMLKLATQKEQLKVVNDQYGCPTCSDWLAGVALQLAVSDAESGLYHSVVDGQTTWHGLASFAIETARNAGMPVLVKPDQISPIPTEDYPLPAPRPQNSMMDNSKLKTTLKKIGANSLDHPWQEQVQQYVMEYVQKLSQ